MLTIGIIGAGRIGKVHLESISYHVKNATVKAIADPFMNDETKAFCEGFGVKDIYNAETVGGFAAEVLGIIPFVGSAFETDEIRGLVTQMDKRRVMQVRVWKKDAPQDGASEEA